MFYMERRNGILQIRFHTGGGPLQWGPGPHAEFGACFADIGSDPDNRVIILTGTGNAFTAEFAPDGFGQISAGQWGHMAADAKRLLMNLLDIEVPMIAAVNGPAIIHAELAVVCDIVLASERAVFQDAPHFSGGLVPGDGVHAVWPLVLGINRGRYFLLTGQQLSAQEALRLGVVNEVVAPEQTAGPGLGAGRADCTATAAQRALRQGRPHPTAQTADAGSARLRSGARRAGSARSLAGTGPGVIESGHQPTASCTFFGKSRMIAHTSSGSALAAVTYRPCTPRSR